MSVESSSRGQADPLHFFPKILAFHKLTSGISFGVTNLSPRRFERLLHFLQNAGYRFGSVKEVVSGQSLSSLAMTFDDGYQHLTDVLPPLIEKYNLRPLVLIPTAFIGKPNDWDYSHIFCDTPHLGPSEIRQLITLGVEFGTHGHLHTALTRCDEATLRTELRQSRNILEDVTGTAVTTISYPFGRFNDRVLAAVAEAGYRLGLTMRLPTANDALLATGRLAVYTYDSRLSVIRKVRGGPLLTIEKLKVRITGSLSAGTDILNRLRGT